MATNTSKVKTIKGLMKKREKKEGEESKKSPVTITIQFSQASHEQLEKLRAELNAVSVSDVIRESLAFLTWSREQFKNGKPLYVATSLEPFKVQRVINVFLE